MNNLISVIVPMYNVENYIDKTLNSIINQTFSNYEIILIDDASTDQTVEIAEKYAKEYQKNIRLVKQPVNQGVSAARNLGMKLAKGDYITFVDADDLLTKEALEILYNTAFKNDADLVIGIYKHLTTSGTRLGSIYKNHQSLTKEGRVFTFTNPEIFSNVYSFAKLYKRELLKEASFPEGITYAEDQPFAFYVYLNAKRIYIAPKVVYYYRDRDKGDSATQLTIKYPLRSLKSVIDSFSIGYKYFENNYSESNKYNILLYFNRVIQGSIRFLFENTLILSNQIIIQNAIKMLKDWIEKVDEYLIAGTDSLERVFFDNGQIYMKYFDLDNQKIYIQLLKLIRDKKFNGTQKYDHEKIIKNSIIEFFLEGIDEILDINNIVKDKNYTICYPNISYFNYQDGEATVHFQLVTKENVSLMKLLLIQHKGRWIVQKLSNEKQDLVTPLMTTNKSKKKKNKILLTYRDFSGCNTLALYKSIPPQISKKFDVELFAGNRMNIDFVRKIEESDIVVTTNMEYGLYKFGFNPNKVVVDLWHGFPLKNMFYEDPLYHDRNSIGQFWNQFNYHLSYSELYSEVVNKCIRVNPNNYFISGAPRNDFLFATDSRKKLFELIGKKDIGQKIIVYMPTFRNSDQKKDLDNSKNIFGMEEFDFNHFNDFLVDNKFELIVKAHPVFTRDFGSVIDESSQITLIESNDLMNMFIDFYEVLGAADILITDYSSVYFDFLLLDKPVIFLPTDLEEYKTERGFILGSYEKWTPGPKVINQSQLQTEILKYGDNFVKYKDLRDQIKNKVHYYQDANSTKRVWEFISSLL